ncbi:MFS transporter [Streptomyces sp. NPDC050625]|uniref:MFS transporter n=1 Tax=Streptomyces sp. NPDC050625 TaxID=3154629 RepID=UPI00344200B3
MLFGEFLSSVGSGTTFPYLVVYLHDVCGLPGGQVGAVLVARSLAAVAGSVVGGSLSDRYGPPRTVVALAATAATATAVMATAVMAGEHGNAVWPGIIGAIVGTGAEAALVPALDALLARSVPHHARERAFSWRNTVVTFGAMLGVVGASAALGALGVSNGLRWVYAVDAASFVVLAALVLRACRPCGDLLRTPEARTPSVRRARSRSALHGCGMPSENYAAVARDPAMRRAFVFVLLVVAAGFAQLQIGLPAVTVLTRHVDALGWLFATNMIVVAVTQVPAQRALARFPRPVVLAGGAACMAGAWVVVAMNPAPEVGTLLTAAVMFALGEVAYMPVIAALINDLAPPGLVGRYNGAHTLAWTSGFAIGALATGTLLGTHSIRPFFAAAAAVLGLTAMTALSLGHIRPGESRR